MSLRVDSPVIGSASRTSITFFLTLIVAVDIASALCKATSIEEPNASFMAISAASIEEPTLSKYKKYWYTDDSGSEEPCNAKATSYCSNMSGSFIANAVRKIVMKQPYNERFSFNFPTMLLQKSSMKS